MQKIRSTFPHASDVVVVEDARRMSAAFEGNAASASVRAKQKRQLARAYGKGCRLHFVRVETCPLADLDALLSEADIVHIEGGQTYHLKDVLARRPKHRALLRRALRTKGGVGQSAGAILVGAFNTAGIKEELGDLPRWKERVGSTWDVADETTLGMLRLAECGVLPHLDSPGVRDKVDKYSPSRPQTCMYALPNKGWVELEAITGRVVERHRDATLYVRRGGGRKGGRR
jgi:peptidase E